MTKIYKLARFFNKSGLVRLSILFEKINMVIYSNCISCSCSIGKGTEFMHHGMCTTVHGKAIIGRNCKIFQNVTIGSKWSNGICLNEAPIIEDNCLLGAGCCILGDITIGANSIIGSNVVVTKNIPPYSIVYGNSCVITKRQV